MKTDYLIIGGGSAGCILANRLSAAPENNVLVLEAGRPDSWWDIFVHMPAALTIPIGNRHYDWMYESQPEPFMNNRQIYHARGKLLGGSSSINGMIFQRGNPLDYERWARDEGMKDWDYAHCLPYFKRMENCLAGGDSFRGDQGPLKLERGPGQTPLFKAFFDAVQQAGYPLTKDVNGYRQEGFSLFDRNIYRGRRLGSSRAYFHPAKHRPNLQLQCRVMVTRILFEGKRAIGVEYKKGKGSLQKAFANEIVLCGGAFNSPQLLQLSGVGNATELENQGIDVIQDLPGVGENLQDHLEVYIQHTCTQPVSMQPSLKKYKRPWIGLQWLFRKGPAATNHFEAGGFISGNENVTYPNIMFHFLPLAIRYDGSSPSGGHGYQVHVGPMYADTRGTVKITTKDPQKHPEIRFNYLSTSTDRQEWIEAVRTSRRILEQPAFAEFSGGEISPGPSVKTDEEILDWVARDAETALHPSCTCKMGNDTMSVVDPGSMKVQGLEGLRVVDASAMPYITNGNIYAPVAMIAEKAADLILGLTTLEPEQVTFFRKGETNE